MPKAHCSPYTVAFEIKVITEAEAVENNSEIAQDYGLSESVSLLARAVSLSSVPN